MSASGLVRLGGPGRTCSVYRPPRRVGGRLGVMPRAVGRPDVATLVRAYVDGNQSIAALAVQFGVAAQTVHNWLVAADVPRRPNAVAPRGDVDDDEISRLYCDEHRSGAEISKLLGCSASLVYFRLARLRIDRRSPDAARRGPSDAELAHLYTERGLSLRDIGEAPGVSTQTVRRWLIHAGIDRRRSAPRPQGARTSASSCTRPAGPRLTSPITWAVRRRPCTPASRSPARLDDSQHHASHVLRLSLGLSGDGRPRPSPPAST
jgi:transposase-like protein